jgi:hypothetical protein
MLGTVGFQYKPTVIKCERPLQENSIINQPGFYSRENPREFIVSYLSDTVYLRLHVSL